MPRKETSVVPSARAGWINGIIIYFIMLLCYHDNMIKNAILGKQLGYAPLFSQNRKISGNFAVVLSAPGQRAALCPFALIKARFFAGLLEGNLSLHSRPDESSGQTNNIPARFHAVPFLKPLRRFGFNSFSADRKE